MPHAPCQNAKAHMGENRGWSGGDARNYADVADFFADACTANPLAMARDRSFVAGT
jgi:hypothetical protein